MPCSQRGWGSNSRPSDVKSNGLPLTLPLRTQLKKFLDLFDNVKIRHDRRPDNLFMQSRDP